MIYQGPDAQDSGWPRLRPTRAVAFVEITPDPTLLLERELSSGDAALQLGHTDGGRLVQTRYGHPDERLARDGLKMSFAADHGHKRDGRALVLLLDLPRQLCTPSSSPARARSSSFWQRSASSVAPNVRAFALSVCAARRTSSVSSPASATTSSGAFLRKASMSSRIKDGSPAFTRSCERGRVENGAVAGG